VAINIEAVEGRMKLITWNIQWCRGCDGKVDPGRIVADARALGDFDVLCLQEVAANFPGLDGSSGEDQFHELAELLPGFDAVPGVAVDLPDPRGGRRRFGNLILSRLPVLRVLRHQLPWPAGAAKAGMPRMLLEAVVRSALGEVRVMTTHLEYYSAAHRAAQVAAIRAIHAQSCGHARRDAKGDTSQKPDTPFQWSPHPVSAILTGDFNYKPDDGLHRKMQAPIEGEGPRLMDGWALAHPGAEHDHTLGLFDRKQWPTSYASDFIYVTEDLAGRVRRVTVDLLTQSSDHQPVMIELG
jgi:endonuclease/exonuclease/phosphatase family metal-dependent hydrolase